MGHEAKRQLVFLDAIAADPLNCKEKEVVKFIELLQRRLGIANRHASSFTGWHGKTEKPDEQYDTTPIARRDLLELGRDDFAHSWALERLLNRSLDSALHDLRFFSRDREEQSSTRTGESDSSNGDREKATPAPKGRARLPLKIETVLTELFDQLAETFDTANSPATVVTLISQIPTCLKGLALAAEKWLSPEQREECLGRYFHKVAIACLAPGVASVARRSGAVRRLEDSDRKKLSGGPEFELGIAMLETYLLLDHHRHPLRDGSINKDLFDVLRELPKSDNTTLAAASEDIQQLMGQAANAKPDFESLRSSMAAVTGEFGAMRGAVRP